MGSQEVSDEVTILVTGFEAFQAKYPINPSFEIAKLLSDVFKSGDGIKIILHEPPLRVVYEHVSELIPRLLDAYQDRIDMVLHIGMASGRKIYTIERLANRDGYTKHKDLDDKVLDEDYGTVHFPDCSPKMTSSFDYERLLSDWWAHVPATDEQELPLRRDELCRSDDAGSFLCDFTYFNSLAYYARRAKGIAKVKDRPVMFLHVPGESDKQALKRGTVVATALVRAMADQIVYR